MFPIVLYYDRYIESTLLHTYIHYASPFYNFSIQEKASETNQLIENTCKLEQ